MRPPRYHDQDFMAQRWSHQRGSVPVKTRIAKARQLVHARRPVGVNVFFLSARRVTLLYETGFLHIKRIKTFGYKTCNREGIRKNFKILQKNNIEALVISIEKTTQVALVDDRTVAIIIWRPKRVFDVFRRKLSLGAPVNYHLTLPLLSLPA